MVDPIVIAGGGLAGAFMAALLAKSGYECLVVEKRSDPRKITQEGNRSINLAISVRGLTSLERVASLESWSPLLIPMYGRSLHQPDGNLTFQPYALTREGEARRSIGSISRVDLNKRLIDEAESYGKVKFLFNTSITQVDLDARSLKVSCEQVESDLSFRALLGADGTASVVREALVEKTGGSFEAQFLEYGYKELYMPSRDDGTHAIEKNALHIWPRYNFMLIGLPNPDGSYTCTLFLPNRGDESFAQLSSSSAAESFMEKHFRDAMDLIPDAGKQLVDNPLGKLGTIKVDPWYYKDRAVIFGDAAHGIVPFYGQGMNAALESACMLFDLLEKHNFESFDKVFSKFEEERQKDAGAIANLAIRNFHEMQDHVADPQFLREKALLQDIEVQFADFKTEYSLVTFSKESYQLAQNEGEAQQIFIRNLLTKYPNVSSAADPVVKREVESYLQGRN